MKPILLSLLCYLFLSACSSDPDDPKDQIKAVLKQIEVAAEDRSRRGISAYISEQYLDEKQQSKESIEKLLQFYLIKNQSINIFTTIQSIELQGPQRAEVQLTAAIAAKSVDLEKEANRLKADLHRFTLLLQDESSEGDWKIITAKWQQGL